MKIYKQERKDGIADKIKANKAIVRASANINDLSERKDKDNKIFDAIIAALKDSVATSEINQEELSIMTSILVSSGWNLNDDIFDNEELIEAKDTVLHKPINKNHEPTHILGHMFASRILDKDGNEVDEDYAKNNGFDIEARGVLYDFVPELSDELNEIISLAKSGELFVSMECLFTNFDYGMFNPEDNKTKIISRSEKTAFLTKYLRAYGGDGKYEGYKIGRVLRNIKFIGNGIVENPANPDSIITDVATDKVAASESKGEYDKMDKETLEKLQKDLDETKASLDKTSKELSDKDAALKAANDENAASVAKIKSLEDEMNALRQKAEEYIKTVEDTNKKYEEMVKQATEASAKYAELAKKETARNRLAELVKVRKVEDESATLAELAEMTEETFKMVLKYSGTQVDAEKTTSAAVTTTEPAEETTITENILDDIDEIDDVVVASGVNTNSDNEVALATARRLLNRTDTK